MTARVQASPGHPIRAGPPLRHGGSQEGYETINDALTGPLLDCLMQSFAGHGNKQAAQKKAAQVKST